MKTRYFIPLLLALAAVSCNKEKAIEENTSGELVELTASIGTPATKIHFAGDMGAYTDTRWEDGDQLWVRSDTQPYWERGDCFTHSWAAPAPTANSAQCTPMASWLRDPTTRRSCWTYLPSAPWWQVTVLQGPLPRPLSFPTAAPPCR